MERRLGALAALDPVRRDPVALECLGDRQGRPGRAGGGEVEFRAKDPKEAYGRLVERLVALVTSDVRSTWGKR